MQPLLGLEQAVLHRLEVLGLLQLVAQGLDLDLIDRGGGAGLPALAGQLGEVEDEERSVRLGVRQPALDAQEALDLQVVFGHRGELLLRRVELLQISALAELAQQPVLRGAACEEADAHAGRPVGLGQVALIVRVLEERAQQHVLERARLADHHAVAGLEDELAALAHLLHALVQQLAQLHRCVLPTARRSRRRSSGGRPCPAGRAGRRGAPA